MVDETPNSKSPTSEKRAKSASSRGSIDRDRSRKRRSRSTSRERRRRRSYSRSKSPIRPYRGGRNNRFGRRSPRRSPYRGPPRYNRFNDRRSRSRDRDRFGGRGRRYDRNRRSRSASPSNDAYMQPQAASVYAEGYGNYMPAAPDAPNFGSMAQMNSQYSNYDFQAVPAFPPPAPTFSGGIDFPAPPGMGAEGWVPPPTEEEILRREAAIADEKKRQQDEMKKQLDLNEARVKKMKRELKMLRYQKDTIMKEVGSRSLSPKTKGFLKENVNLQKSISTKLTEVLEGIDMLNGIMGIKDDEPVKKKSNKRSDSDSDTSEETIFAELMEAKKHGKKKGAGDTPPTKHNYFVYDNELHWCKSCQVFPKTAKEYLLHLHTKEHAEKINKNPSNAPWRENFQKTNIVTTYPDAPTKNVPIRGLQFFEPSTAWFCKLCEVFMGDSWCASLHLKSDLHIDKYEKFTAKEPKFEDKWLEARKKALDTFGNKSAVDSKRKEDKKAKKKKNKRDTRKDKKRSKKHKRESSSSSSDSSESDSSSSSDESVKKNDGDQAEKQSSIRVQMRNLLDKETSKNDEHAGKWTMVSNSKPMPPPAPAISHASVQESQKDEQILGQWSSVEPIISQEEKRLLENLKGRLKSQQAEAKPSSTVRKVDEREKDRNRERSREKNYNKGRKSRSRSRSRRSRSHDRRSRSRSRSRGRRRRYSRSRSRSGSRNRRRAERPVISFPTEPKLPPLREEKKLPARSYVISKKDDGSATSKKVMPLIGKMPVYKKLIDKKSEEPTETKKNEAPAEEKTTENKKPKEDSWEQELMPDPLQYSALMGAPPPPPARVEESEVIPPGLDPEQDSEFIPKPINDVPIASKAPLPKDLQATLDLLYDGDTPKPVVIEPKIPDTASLEPSPVVVDPDIPQMIMPEELSYSGFYGDGSNGVEDKMLVENKGGIRSSNHEEEANDSIEMADADDSMKDKQMDMDELALLGIDINDVGSGLW